MINITLKYGLTGRLETEVSEGTTVRQLVQNPNFKAVLRFPETVSAVCDGVTLSMDDEVNDGDTIVFEKQAASKAA